MSASLSVASPAPDAVLDAVLLECECAAGGLLLSVPALAALTTGLVCRNEDARARAQSNLARARAALVATSAFVIHSARLEQHTRSKQRVAVADALKVSVEQLRVCVAVVGDGVLESLDGALLAASPLLAQPPAHDQSVTSLSVCAVEGLPLDGELGSVATGDGLVVVSAAGPGLKRFDPNAQNEFRVVLGLADGSVPSWLSPGDVTLITDPACASVGTITSTVSVLGGFVSVTYTVTLRDTDCDTPQSKLESLTRLSVTLHLAVCGVPIACANASGGVWSAAVRRKAVRVVQCVARGVSVRVVDDVVKLTKHAMAVSDDKKWLAVGAFAEGMIFVHSLPDGSLVRSFGLPAMWKSDETTSGKNAARAAAARGDGPLHFDYLSRMCFAPNGNLVVVDNQNKRLQEVTLEGLFVRFIGLGEFALGSPFCVDVLDDVIAVGCYGGTGPRVLLFDFDTGAVMSRFGVVGTAPGQLSLSCTGIRFTQEGSHLAVAEREAARVSVFTTAGVFVRCVGAGVLEDGYSDVLLSAAGELVVADDHNHCVCVFAPDGLELVRRWDAAMFPTALAVAGCHLYVMAAGGRVHVYE